MKKILLGTVLTTSLLASNFIAPKADALIGVIFKNRIVKTIGGIGAIGGGTLGLYGAGIAYSSTATLGSAIAGAVFIAYGIVLGGIGVIILDDKVSDIEFKKFDLDRPDLFGNFTLEEIQIYNSEIEQLNAIRQTISAEVSETEDTKDAEDLWNHYAPSLHPTTFEIAKAQAKEFVESL